MSACYFKKANVAACYEKVQVGNKQDEKN